jgi:DNA polymerase III sliding clamp (beta) subunit (PCNA family)
MIATDGQRMSFYDLDTPMETFWINDSCVKTLLKYSFTEHVMLPEYILFYTKEFTIAVKRLRDTIYPVSKLEAVYKTMVESGTFNIPKGFTEAVEKAASMGVEDGICKIFLTFESDYSIITGDKRTGTYEEEIEGAAISGKFIGLYKHLSSIADGDEAGLCGGYLFVRRQDSLVCMAGLREE